MSKAKKKLDTSVTLDVFEQTPPPIKSKIPLESVVDPEPTLPSFEPGAAVRVTKGYYRGLTGTVIRPYTNDRMIIRIDEGGKFVVLREDLVLL